MVITIFGATGNVGKQLVKQALYNGHTVKAFGRNVFTAGFREEEKLHLVQGAVFDEQQVLEAVSGSGAVLSVIGGIFNGTDKTRSLGLKNIITQMTKAGVRRIIALGGAGLLENEQGKLLMDEPGFDPAMTAISHEHYQAYTFLKSSVLEWTFVCAPAIIEHEATGEFQVSATLAPVPNHEKINSGDLALFMLHELDKNEFLYKKAGISN